MEIFLDSCDLGAIDRFASLGVIGGVTTNPSIIAKSELDFVGAIKRVCDIVKGPVSAQVVSSGFEAMQEEGLRLYDIYPSCVVVKVPLTYDGLRACNYLAKRGIPVNVTLCFSQVQALLGARAGCSYISPFIGRLDDIQEDGVGLISDIREMFLKYPSIKTRIIAASIRNADHVRMVSRAGCDIATCPPALIDEMLRHNLTDQGLEKFSKDWKLSQKSIS